MQALGINMKRYVLFGASLGLLVPLAILIAAYLFGYQYGISTVVLWPSSLLYAVASDLRPKPYMPGLYAQAILFNVIWYVILACIAYFFRRLVAKAARNA
jgi:hypothetical protein